MAFMASPSDVVQLVNTAQRLEPNPLTLAGKLVGLGDAEQAAGIPLWAFLIAGLGAGVAIGFAIAPKFSQNSHPRRRLSAFE